MKKFLLTIIFGFIYTYCLFSQGKLVEVTKKVFKINEELSIDGQIGYLEVPENRQNLASRKIKIKYVWLKSLSKNTQPPVVFLEGGSGTSTWQTDEPTELADWIELLKVRDLIFVDRRGSTDESLNYIWTKEFPEDFFTSAKAASIHYEQMIKASLEEFEKRGVDIKGYTVEAHANDVNELMTALKINQYSIFGFSFGSHIGMTIMKLFPKRIERAIFSGADAPHQAFNFPSHMDAHIDKLAALIEADHNINKVVPDFRKLVTRVMRKLAQNPAIVTINNPITGKKMKLKIGAYGFGVILRLDMDDYNDIPVLPRLLYNMDQGDYSMLSWFAQKRVAYSLAIPGSGINQQLASGVGNERWAQILKEAEKSMFGNAVNFPFDLAKEHWPENKLSFDYTIPITSTIPTLFITGSLDCRTPIEQVEETMKGFKDTIHVRVENAGHEQAHWNSKVADEIIPLFLRKGKIDTKNTYYGDIEFIKIRVQSNAHPSIR